MTYVQPAISELALVGVADPGVANKERVVLRPTQVVALKQFGITLGMFDPSSGGARPIFDNTFWFPDLLVEAPAWILVYTGRGKSTEGRLPNGDRVVTLFWHRQYTVFDNPIHVPVLFRLDAAIVGRALR